MKMNIKDHDLHTEAEEHSISSFTPRKQGATQTPHDFWFQLTSQYDEVSGVAPITKNTTRYHPIIEDFRHTIEHDPHLYMLFHEMFDQVPLEPPYDKDPTGRPQVRDYETLLASLDGVLRYAPSFQSKGIGLEVLISNLFQWPMATPAGVEVFLHHKVNAHIKKILDEWGHFLRSPQSTSVLSTDPVSGWFGQSAMAAIPNFANTFVCNPQLPHHGFLSWDNFFTRCFRPGIRPVASPCDDNIITNACESSPYRLAHSVKVHDRFWVKGQPYSLAHMLASDPFAPQFAGGTVYQAYLSSLSYHRWHSPINGTIRKAYVVPGTYFSELLSEGFDPTGPDRSMAYITQVATRALVFIEADNPAIGVVAFLAVGMNEISSCEITVEEGQRVNKGDQMGMFHLGGSTWCLVLRPEVDVSFHVSFDLKGQSEEGPGTEIVKLNTAIATVGRGTSRIEKLG